MFDCNIIEKSACLTQASKFHIALTYASTICNGNRIAACCLSVNAPFILYTRGTTQKRTTSPQLSAEATQLQRNVAAVASRWIGTGIEPQIA